MLLIYVASKITKLNAVIVAKNDFVKK